MKRVFQFLLIASTLGLTWLGMMIVHELGHVFGAWMSGGSVSKVVLHPLVFSQTVLSHNPHPLFVVWCGPVLGVLIPIVLLVVSTLAKAPGFYLVRFYTGFCLIANGAYLGVGSFAGVADAGDLIELGASPWMLWVFGFLTIPAVFWLWHGLGPKFGLGAANGRVSRAAACAVTASLILVVAFEVIFSPI